MDTACRRNACKQYRSLQSFVIGGSCHVDDGLEQFIAAFAGAGGLLPVILEQIDDLLLVLKLCEGAAGIQHELLVAAFGFDRVLALDFGDFIRGFDHDFSGRIGQALPDVLIDCHAHNGEDVAGEADVGAERIEVSIIDAFQRGVGAVSDAGLNSLESIAPGDRSRVEAQQREGPDIDIGFGASQLDALAVRGGSQRNLRAQMTEAVPPPADLAHIVLFCQLLHDLGHLVRSVHFFRLLIGGHQHGQVQNGQFGCQLGHHGAVTTADIQRPIFDRVLEFLQSAQLPRRIYFDRNSAVGILVLLSIFAVVAGKKEEEGNPGEHDPEEFNTRDDG